MVLVAAYGQLRFGELIGLRRRDIDLRAGTVVVHSQLVEPEKGVQQRTDPKSEAGRRQITLPDFVVTELRHHRSRTFQTTWMPRCLPVHEVDSPAVATGPASGRKPATAQAFPTRCTFTTYATWAPPWRLRAAEPPRI
jgi:integrase